MRLASIHADDIEPLVEFLSDSYEGYVSMREEAERRLNSARSPIQAEKALKVLLYVQHRAQRENGYIV